MAESSGILFGSAAGIAAFDKTELADSRGSQSPVLNGMDFDILRSMHFREMAMRSSATREKKLTISDGKRIPEYPSG